ncbi:MAG: protein-glutamate O-methyltransferase CheR [Proteobacteria bacterium]|nr:protein-glutamate O-methyltransferase CheR [Pseudomonadota bacterium]
MWDISAGPTLKDDEFESLRNLIRDKCGIYFDDSSRYILEKRLAGRIKELKFNTFKEYIFFLKYDKKKEDEFTFIYDVITTNETYFFREDYQLKAFKEEIIPELIELKKDDKNIRIWSAGCSTGEEPYTIAMIIYEVQDLIKDYRVTIFGSDISQRCLKIAREGIYNANSFRTTSEAIKRKYFDEIEQGKWQVKQNIRELVSFGQLNLLDRTKMSILPTMDIIFCRNVLIYFDMNSRKKVIDNFFEKLIPGGFLLLGHAESLINISTDFTIKHFKNDMVYLKPKV